MFQKVLGHQIMKTETFTKYFDKKLFKYFENVVDTFFDNFKLKCSQRASLLIGGAHLAPARVGDVT